MEVINRIEKFFSEEWWPIVADKPAPFVAAVIIGFLIAASYTWVRSDIYEREIESYKERLHEATRESKYERKTNTQLKEEVGRWGQRLREFQQDIKYQEGERKKYFAQRRTTAKSQQEQEALLQEESQRASEDAKQWADQFQKEYVGETRYFITEIRERLPEKFSPRADAAQTNQVLNSKLLSGSTFIGDVIDDLEERAASLPPSTYGGWFTLRWLDLLFALILFLGGTFWLLRRYALYRQRRLRPFLVNARKENAFLKQRNTELEKENKELTELRQPGKIIIENITANFNMSLDKP